MYGKLYAVDVITADGIQEYDELCGNRTTAEAEYYRTVEKVRQIAVHDVSDDTERTVRIICNGDVLASTTIRWGDILDSFNRL